MYIYSQMLFLIKAVIAQLNATKAVLHHLAAVSTFWAQTSTTILEIYVGNDSLYWYCQQCLWKCVSYELYMASVIIIPVSPLHSSFLWHQLLITFMQPTAHYIYGTSYS